MDSTSYNRYLSVIKEARYMDERRAREILRQIQADMIARYGLGDNDVDYLIRQFHLNV